MRIISITTSVNYGDYLPNLLHTLAPVVDSAVVVTAENDASIEIAKRYNATPLVFPGWHDYGASLNKSGAVRAAQEMVYGVEPEAWYLVIDADIVLPDNAREIIERQATDQSALYGASRVDFHTPIAMREGKPTKIYESQFAGFFQLYRRQLLYPKWSRSAEACDLQFATQFTSCVMLPLTVGHCGEEAVNWEGRRSPLWRV
jgi:hypothetical protein